MLTHRITCDGTTIYFLENDYRMALIKKYEADESGELEVRKFDEEPYFVYFDNVDEATRFVEHHVNRIQPYIVS